MESTIAVSWALTCRRSSGVGVRPDHHPDAVDVEDPDVPQGVRPLGVDPRLPHEVVVAPARIRSQLVGGGVRGRPELQVLPRVPAQGDVDGTRHVEVRVIHERGHELVDGRPGRDVRSGPLTELGVQPAAAHDQEGRSAGWRVALDGWKESRSNPDQPSGTRERDANGVVLRARFMQPVCPAHRPPGPVNGLVRIAARRQRAIRDRRRGWAMATGSEHGVGGAVWLGPGTPTPSLPGNKLIPTIATTTTAVAAIANFKALFISLSLHAGHQARRCEVVGSWSSTLSRTRSGSAVAPSSNHDRTMRVTSRSVLIGQPPACLVWRLPRGPRAGRASRDAIWIEPSRRGRRGRRRPRREEGRGSGAAPPPHDGRWRGA